jgi:phosphoglycerate dehydrogenase-like enzyme
MHKHAVFVNAARGGLVDEQALVNALQLGWIKAAALDVTEHEPLSVNSPLLTLPNCIVLPHLGTSTQESRDNMGFMAIQNAVAGMKGDLMPAEIQ